MDETKHPWSPGWEDCIIAQSRELGYATLSDLLAAMPDSTYKEVAKRLGSKIAPIQVIKAQYREAIATNSVRSAARDSLCRNIVEELPDGWGVGEKAEWKSVLALANWSSELKVTGECDSFESVAANVVEAIRSSPPVTGWLPEGSTDPYIESVFNSHWPES